MNHCALIGIYYETQLFGVYGTDGPGEETAEGMAPRLLSINRQHLTARQ